MILNPVSFSTLYSCPLKVTKSILVLIADYSFHNNVNFNCRKITKFVVHFSYNFRWELRHIFKRVPDFPDKVGTSLFIYERWTMGQKIYEPT